MLFVYRKDDISIVQIKMINCIVGTKHFSLNRVDILNSTVKNFRTILSRQKNSVASLRQKNLNL